MPNEIPVNSFSFDFTKGKLEVKVDGQPVDLRLLQKVEVVLDAQLMAPFVRLTVLAGDTGIKLGNCTLEVHQGDPGKPTFGQYAGNVFPDSPLCGGPAAPGHQA